MNCEEIRRRFIDRALEEVPPEEARSLDEHIRSCAACAQAWEEITATHELLARGVVQVEPPRHFRLVPAETQAKTGWWERLWAPVLRVGLSAGVALFLLVASLALFGASVSRQNGAFRITFGRETTPAQRAVVPPAEIQQAVQTAVGEAERRLEQKQKDELTRLTAELKPANGSQVRRLGERLQLLQSAQTQIWKETQRNNYLVQLVARDSATRSRLMNQ